MMLSMWQRLVEGLILSAVPMMLITSCSPTEPNELDKLGTVQMTINDQTFQLWIADEFEEQQRGLMFITAEQMAPLPNGTPRGMIFIFDHEQELNFWMKNTIIPLDIAYLQSNGTVTAIHTMAPLDDSVGKYPSNGPARIAIEFNAGTLAPLGVKAGDNLQLPPTVLKLLP